MSGEKPKCPVPNMQTQASTPCGHVLFVDDDADVLKAASLLLGRNGRRMTSARSPGEAWSALAAEPVDVILLDLNFSRGANSGEEGFRFLAEIVAQDPDVVVVVVTAHSGVRVAVEAMRGGASDFVMKPWNNDRLLATLDHAINLRQKRRLTSSGGRDNGEVTPDVGGLGAPILGNSEAIQRVRELLRRISPTDASVLIYGEAGVGKSLIARNVHLQSRRLSEPFVLMDLAALSAAEADLALFGDGRTSGAFLRARGGTLFLDEIFGLAASLQTKIHTLLETQCILPLGESAPVKLDVRVVASTRRTREDLQSQGGVRDELLYRLNTVEIFAPPLRERGEDSVLLAEHFLKIHAKRYGRPAKSLATDAKEAIRQNSWTGDVRALRQAMERCVIFADGPQYEVSDLLPSESPEQIGWANASGLNLAQSEKAMIAAALKQNNFNLSHSARQLGLSRAALYRRMAKYDL